MTFEEAEEAWWTTVEDRLLLEAKASYATRYSTGDGPTYEAFANADNAYFKALQALWDLLDRADDGSSCVVMRTNGRTHVFVRNGLTRLWEAYPTVQEIG